MNFPATWQRDALAGLAVAGLILPEAIAYSGIGNLPPIAGIVSACLGLLIYAVTGASRFAVVAATSSSAVVLAAAVRSLQVSNPLYAAELAAGLVMLAGLVFFVCGMLQMGRMGHFIARPVVRGLAFGLAIVIVIKQLAVLTGVSYTHSDIFGLMLEALRHLRAWNLTTLAFGGSVLALLIMLRRWPQLPGPSIVLIVAIIANQLLTAHGHAVAVVGAISLSTINVSVPNLQLDDWLRLGELAVALTLILFAESYSAMRVFALKHGDVVSTNRELVALGLANLCTGLCHAMPVGAGYSATSVNEAAGTQSRLAGLVAGLCVAIAALGLLHYVEQIPIAALSAIIIYAMRHALDPEPLRIYFRWRRDQLIVIVAVLAVLLFGVLDGLLAAIAVSLILLIKGFAEPRLTQLGQLGQSHDFVSMDSHAEAHSPAGMLILRPEAPLFFANVSEMLDHAWQLTQRDAAVRIVILSLEETPDIDGTTIEVLGQFAQHLAGNGRTLRFARLKLPVIAALTRARPGSLNTNTLSEDSVATVVTQEQQTMHAAP